MRKKTIASLILLGVIVVGAYEGYGMYMRNKLTKAYAGLATSNALQLQAELSKKDSMGEYSYNHLGSVNAFDYAGTYLPDNLKGQFEKCKQIQEKKPTNKAKLYYNQEKLLDECKDMCDTFNVKNKQVSHEVQVMLDKFKNEGSFSL